MFLNEKTECFNINPHRPFGARPTYNYQKKDIIIKNCFFNF